MLLENFKNRVRENKKKLSLNLDQEIRLYYAENYESKEIDENLIFYETRDGKSIVDSPYAMFLELATNPNYINFKHIWVIDKESTGIENSIPKNLQNKVNFVERGTLDYVESILTAKYLISNSTFESFFVKRPGQVYINTWHGTPLKYMGFDIPGAVNHSQNVLRNFLMTDFLLSPNYHTSEIFINSYKLNGIYPGQILEGGYPRVDLTLNTDPDTMKRKLLSSSVILDATLPILLFSPTWKGSSVNDAEDDVDQIVKETLILVKEYQGVYNVVVKVHPFVYSKVKEDKKIAPYLVSDLFDANEVLSIIDVLVTDYSSIFFDFLVTNKPIIFYSWDKDLYEEDRGMYLTEDELPGPTAENLSELINLINVVDEQCDMYKAKYQTLAGKMTSYDDGMVTQKYVEYIFNKKKSSSLKIYELVNEKKKLVIYPGGMKNNGITSSLINLVNNIDYDTYDITIITNSTKNKEINSNLKAINPNARVMFRFGANILTKHEREIDRNFMDHGVSLEEKINYPEIGYKREMNRLMANLSFDVSIDFSGYSYFWGRHMLAVNAKKYVAFMHNDLMSDSMREINGKTPMKNDLHGLFSIYYKFDKLLSVSPMTMEVNYNSLQDFVTKEQMSYVYNSINIDAILGDRVVINEDSYNSILINKKNKLVLKTELIKSFKNISAIENHDYLLVNILKDTPVLEHATFMYNEVSYSKVSIDGLYVGWIETDNFVLAPIKIDGEVKEHFFGTVGRGFHFPIWKEIRTNSETDQIVAYAGHFKNRYLEVVKSAETVHGKYYLVKYNGQKIGWMSTNPLMRIHKMDPLKFKALFFRWKMKQKEENSPTIYSNKVENDLNDYAQLKKNKTTSLWSAPRNVVDAVEIPISDEYFDLGFKVSQAITFSNEIYYRLTLDDDTFVGYVIENDCSFINKETYLEILKENITEETEALSMLPKVDLVMQKIPEFNPAYFNFVNMGRLSPEKNQIALISAFKKINAEIPNSRLYILGKGPLQNELVDHVRQLELEGKVILLGHIKQPFEFMKLTDYFVLPSIYEGQPMVLLESLTIGMKILASNIPANINVIGADEKYGLLTKGTSVENIYEGMKRAFTFEGEFASFDYHKYNQQAIETFYNEIS